MRKTLFAALAFVMMVGVAIVLPLSSAHATSTFVAETETKIYIPEKSYGGYFMPVNNGAGADHYLMDMLGNVVHKWTGKPAGTVSSLAAPGIKPMISEDGNLWSGGMIQDWNGNVLWDFYPPRDVGISVANMPFHHDMKKIWNKKLNQWTQLIVSNRARTQAEAAAAGGDPATPTSRLTGLDYIIEVNMDRKIVWQWDFYDHTVQNQFPTRPRYISGDVSTAPGKFDVYWQTDNQRPRGTAGLVADWMHVNSVDFNDETGHVVINPKHFSDFIVVDHDKTFVSTTDFPKNIAAAAGPDGDVIYRWGNPSSYNAGAAPGWLSEGDSQMYGSHNIQFIRPYHWQRPKLATDTWPDPAGVPGTALPGAGNFLIFDNGCYNPTRTGSRVLEIDPRIGASGTAEVAYGKYIWPVTAGYNAATGNYQRRISKQTVFSYQSQQMHSFYSSHISGMQRLPNGNTSINSGNQGLMFEVTPTKQVVWQYQYPMANIAGVGQAAKPVSTDGTLSFQIDDGYNKGQAGSMFRHERVGVNHPALTGKDLTPQGTLTGLEPRLIGEGRTKQMGATGFGYGGSSGGGGGASGGGSGGGGGY